MHCTAVCVDASVSEGRVLTFLSLLTLEGLASSALGLFLGSFSPSVTCACYAACA